MKVEFVDLSLQQIADICQHHGCGNCPIEYWSEQCKLADKLRCSVDNLHAKIELADEKKVEE